MNLVIVESPTKAKTLSRFLGSQYQIEATMGHIRDLPKKKIGIEIKETEQPRTKNQELRTKNKNLYEFMPDYQAIPERKKRISELKKIAAEAGKIILATDPDREGEAIAWHVTELIKGTKGSKGSKSSKSSKSTRGRIGKFQNGRNLPDNFQRIVFHEITESAIAHALQNPRGIDMQLVDAQQARRILDRIVGYKLSPLLWYKLNKRWLSAGRVQSVAVRLIVEREREIEAFKPEEYWVIDVELEKTKNLEQRTENKLIARLIEVEAKKADVKNKETADKIVADLKVSDYQVINVEAKEATRYPSPPFITSTLQQQAANKFGWSAKRTMRTAQSLYEEGLITYHRTDSTNLSTESISMVRGYLNNVYGKDYLPVNPKFYKTKSKVAQEAHEAIRPTDIKLLASSDFKKIRPDQIKELKIKSLSDKFGREADLLYSLIWRRFLSCQMNEAVFDQTVVLVVASKNGYKYILKSTGEKIKFIGWMVIYDQVQTWEEKKELPLLESGEVLKMLQILPQQKFTEPPVRYTEATLIRTLEEKGIGRPSTYAPIISTIQDRKYVEKIERKFKPTDLGYPVNDFLVKYFPDIFDVSFTAKMEDDLDNIASGQLVWNSVMSDFYAPFKEKVDLVYKQAERVKVDLGTTSEKCPKDGGDLVYRLSKFGKFLACSNYPTCKFTKTIVEKAGLICPSCGGDIIVKRTRRGKQFYGCSNYPKCKFAAWKKEDILKSTTSSTSITGTTS